MSKVDTAWLRMEQPTNRMMVTGVVGLEPEATYERFVEAVGSRFLSFRRFRQKAVENASGAHWEVDEDFDIRGHVRRVALPGRADRDELDTFVSDLASTSLDTARPLWQFDFVENYVHGPVVVMRLHHCYADGIALVQVFLSLTDAAPEPTRPPAGVAGWRRRRAAESTVFQRLLEPTREGLDCAAHLARRVCDEARQLVGRPELAADYLDIAGDLLRELAHSLLLPPDPATCLKGPLGVRKRVAWTEPVPLDEVKAVGKALGCTVNDVLIAAVSGAIRGYLLERQESGPCEEIRATVPVNLRPLEHAKELGNHFGLVFLSLPVGEANPLRRVYLVNERMNELKASRQATVSFGLLAVLGMGPHAVQKPTLELLSEKATTVLTNVPGPQQPLYLAGGRVREMMFWVPQSGTIGMGVSILSYDGRVFLGVMTDQRLVPDPSAIVGRFRPELEKLLHLVLMLPVDGRPSPEDAENLLM